MLEYCPECRSTNLYEVALKGELVCKNCGLVIDEANFERNPFVSIGVKNRATLPILAKAGTETKCGRIVKNSWLYTTNQKNTDKGLNDIELISEKLNLPEYVMLEAKTLFKELMGKNYSWGRGLNYLSYSCVYVACNLFQLPKTTTEICLYAHIDKRIIWRYAKKIAKEFNLQLSTTDPLDLISRFASNLDLSQPTLTKAIDLVMKIKENNLLIGKRPETIVAVALYIASKNNNEYRTQRDVANNTGVVETTIRNNAKLVK
ncbi:MAG: TFIIB-type zinc ribbon-containing protein [Candidatus Woesearchaeota archaeon]